MRLPKDQNDWHDRHLEDAIREMEHAFNRYERVVGSVSQQRSDALFQDYLNKEERARCVATVVRPNARI